ncbi:hypothetical protein BVC80_1751g164 [Macleaya cordata]|uniref:Uncharacterized protein n=1 Tax=Macleaya cordata TaxID=56857 RepID=A0A200QHZ2_MACCD|nr:hypothetical protein BVC80_1751g164 [Macleaya cordata]
MPQIDLETLGGGGGGGGGVDKRRIANETLIDGELKSSRPDLADDQSDFPAESFYLRKEDEVDWLARNAFHERKASSTRRNSNNSISHSNSTSSTTSQRFFLNLKSKASIIGLPKPQKSCFVECKVRRNFRPSRARFFPKRSRSSGKTSVPQSEPSSPKVSCIGRVRSKKETIIARSRSLRFRNRSTEETIANPKPVKTGFWSNLKAVLRIGHQKDHTVDVKERWTEPLPGKNVTAAKHKGPSVNPVSEPPGLGGLKRFTSGRKSESWGGCDLEFDEGVESVDEFDSPDRGSVFSRRGVSQIKEIDCTRDWESVGPASV